MNKVKRKLKHKIHRFKNLKIGAKAMNLVMFVIGWFIVVLLAWGYVSGFGLKTIVSDNAMSPTFEEEEVVRMNQVLYKLSSPKRFDTVAVKIGETDSKVYYIRRIVGLPGEKVRIENGKIFVDDKEIDYPYNEETIDNAGAAKNVVKLSEDEYFILCDNYNVRMDDSRSANIGVIGKSQIIGKVK